MAGTGYHPEGHDPKPYEGTMARVKWICRNCAEVAKSLDGFSDECIDDM